MASVHDLTVGHPTITTLCTDYGTFDVPASVNAAYNAAPRNSAGCPDDTSELGRKLIEWERRQRPIVEAAFLEGRQPALTELD